MTKVKNKKARDVRQHKYAVALLECGNRVKAAKIAGIGSRTADRYHTEPEFNELLKEEFKNWREELLAAAKKRALRDSDTLMIFLLKAVSPMEFDEGVRRQLIANQGLQDAVAQLPTPVIQTAEKVELSEVIEQKVIEYIED